MNIRIRVWIQAVIALVVVLCSTELFAQTIDGPVPQYNIQRWRPAPMPGDYLSTYGTQSEESWRVTGGLYFNYAHNALRLKQPGSKTPLSGVEHSVYADLFASISLYEYVELSVVLPVALYQSTGVDVDPLKTFLKGETGLGDLRILLKGRILDLRKFPVGLALIADLGTPTGAHRMMASDEVVSFAISAALEFIPWGRARMAFNLGYRYRPARTVYQYTMGQALLLSGAASIPFFHRDLDLLVDLHSEITVDGENKTLVQQERPFEAELAFRYRFINDKSWARGLSMTAGIGAGIDAVGSPDVRVLLGLSFHWVNGGNLWDDYEYGGFLTQIEPCPDPELTPFSQIPERCRKQNLDSDGDTIPDDLDECPFKGRVGYINEVGCPEDSDGDTVPDYEDLCPKEGVAGSVDRTGCPHRDSDHDGIYDHLDKCPHDPETMNGIDDEDGCPDEDPDARISLKDGKINIKEQVFFETSKTKIKEESFSLLDEVAKLLIDNPQIGNIEVEGHTDSNGKYSYNKKLSQGRADSVKKYLVTKGVPATRLSAVGYGPDKPIDTNDTEEGLARNRRVEFTVVGLNAPKE